MKPTGEESFEEYWRLPKVAEEKQTDCWEIPRCVARKHNIMFASVFDAGASQWYVVLCLLKAHIFRNFRVFAQAFSPHNRISCAVFTFVGCVSPIPAEQRRGPQLSYPLLPLFPDDAASNLFAPTTLLPLPRQVVQNRSTSRQVIITNHY